MTKWYWWFTANSVIISAVLGHFYFDIFTKLYMADNTFLGFLILAVTTLTTIFIGINQKKMVGKDNNTYWFTSDAVLSLGMVGTLAGFLMVLGQSLADIDTSSTESMTQAISLLASGMSTALVTSLVGLLSSLFLKLQLVIVEG